ncbi:helix-turn-helix domain-containing protein [Streptomyces albidoflavus]|nr:helix-turn-helix transcriptional regulator [Streptomyces albidoflavus]MCX4468415.1 helix-turn-helix domain-containing protein [Streptomyces albidoflavus]WSI96366.1 helix-turn-helix domain-containing protein [Streptomyces albidoflavus]
MSDFTTDAARATALGRALGARLRHLRIDAGASIAAVAHRLGVDSHSIGRIERGLHSPRKNQIARLLAHYPVPDDEQRAAAELLGQDQTGEGQYQVADALPGWLARATGVERTSSHLHTYALHHFPAPVQTTSRRPCRPRSTPGPSPAPPTRNGPWPPTRTTSSGASTGPASSS